MRKRSLFTLAVLLGVLFFGANSGGAADISVEASLSPQIFSLSEGARLSIVVSGVRTNAEIELPEIKGVKLHPRGQSSQTSFINGAMSASITYNYIVQPLLPGNHTIPPIKVRGGGEELMTKSIFFEVTGAGSANRSTQNENISEKEIAFITVSKTGEHFPGEIVPITLKAYFNRKYRVELNSLPTLSGDGVVMPQLTGEPEQQQEVIDGVPFHVLIWKTTLAGIKIGEHRLTFSLDASLLVAQQQRSRSPFSSFGGSMFDDSLFDNFFGNVQRKPITARSPEIAFNVLPLPKEGQPDNFTGAIGNFSMTVSGTPLTVDIGEPITLTMTIAGTGNFNRVEAPVFPESRSWKTYSPTSDFSAESGEHAGDKSFEQAIVVKQPGVTAIPSLSFSYFDPKAKQFVTLQSEPIVLQVQDSIGLQQSNAKAATMQPGSGADKADNSETASATPTAKNMSEQLVAAKNLAPIDLETGRLHGRLVPLFQKGWFVALCLVCLLVLTVLLFVNWRRQRGEREPERTFQKNRSSQLQKDLVEVERLKDRGDAALFLQRCRVAIQNHVGASRLETAAAISLTDLKKQLDQHSPLLVIFARAEEAAYGGATLSTEEMEDCFVELKTELEKL